MRQAIFNELTQYFENIKDYEHEIEILEAIFENEDYPEELIEDVTFWNHYIALIQRVYDDAQNDFEFQMADEVGLESMGLAERLIRNHEILSQYVITPFELYLLAIYFAKTGKEA